MSDLRSKSASRPPVVATPRFSGAVRVGAEVKFRAAVALEPQVLK